MPKKLERACDSAYPCYVNFYTIALIFVTLSVNNKRGNIRIVHGIIQAKFQVSSFNNFLAVSI